MSSRTAQPDRLGLGVIEPKLMLPRVRVGMLRRARLLELLDADERSSLVVLNAGAGYGKTTLVRSWCSERPEPVIWITLDRADDDPVRLWTHLATAVERLGEGLGRRALMSLAARGAPLDSAVDELMNGLAEYGQAVTIVLDDLHVVTSESSLRSIEHAIARLPTNARLVVLTRADPEIGVARLRARRTLTEVRAHQLVFTVGETQELLVREGVELTGESVEMLAERTEGWPAGLYLAALWLRELDNADEGVRALAGSTRHVADYLSEEVLAALAPDTREFLLRSSVLPRFTPALCDAVLGRNDSVAVLGELERSNMFLVPLDTRGEWHRYHHLFGELLQLELGHEDAAELRHRAAAWCRSHGLVEDAIEYAAAAHDAKTVADLLVEHHLDFIWGGRIRQFLGWGRWLPSGVLLANPLLSAVGAFAAAILGDPEVEVQQLLALAERARVERSRAWSPYLEAVVEVTRAALIENGDVGAAVDHARRAVAAAHAGADVLTVGVLASLSQALFFAGDLDEAKRTATLAVEHPAALGVPDGYVAGLGLLALIDAERGRFEGAEAWARQAISFARSRFQADSWVASPAHLGLALACAATGRIAEAEREALRGEQLRRSPQPTVGHAHALLILAQVRVARSRLTSAAGSLKRAQGAIAEFADPGRLPAIAAGVAQGLASNGDGAGNRAMVEDPSPAEVAVLRGLASGLSRREIGAQLYISLNTVKTHTRELYRKLDATTRSEAIARAAALGLLETSESPG